MNNGYRFLRFEHVAMRVTVPIFQGIQDIILILLILGLVTIWALRLSAHITIRNHGEGEDRRYRQIRANHEPGFTWKSLYIGGPRQPG